MITTLYKTRIENEKTGEVRFFYVTVKHHTMTTALQSAMYDYENMTPEDELSLSYKISIKLVEED